MENSVTPVSLDTGQKKFEFKPLRTLYKLFFWFAVFAFLVEAVRQNMHALLFSRLTPGPINYSGELATVGVGLIGVGLWVTATVFFFIWIYRSSENLHAFGKKNITYSPGWSVGWFFIPFANLAMPYLVLNQLLNKSSNGTIAGEPEDEKSSKASPLWIITWWTTFLVDLAASGIYMVWVFLSAAQAMTNLEGFYGIARVYGIVALVLLAVHTTAAILMLRQVTNLQEISFKQISGNT